MKRELPALIEEICQAHNNDPTRMMDIVRDVQASLNGVSKEAMKLIAGHLSVGQVNVESVVSFYDHFHEKQKGKVIIRLCNDYMDMMMGAGDVAATFEEEFGIKFGQTSSDGLVSLEYTPCIGMCDQAPSALVNGRVVTMLTKDMAKKIAASIKEHGSIDSLELPLGDGNNSHPLVASMVQNNIRKRGEVIFDDFTSGTALSNALAMTPAEVIRYIKTSRLRGRGGAGFPTGMKLEFTRAADGDDKYIFCNADEGEPGTFKDRVILTETPDLMFEGMTIAAYAVGAKTGIVYLRAEYVYLQKYLESVLEKRREEGLLGTTIAMREGFDFDIRIQIGAGAYICGEETALISSCEGLRGDPKNRPPFPAQKGYLARPSCVSNVETLCAAARVMHKGASWFAKIGSAGSSGLKLLSVSGDCERPGVYELPFGTCLKDLLKMVGGEDAIAVQVGGASGQIVGPDSFCKTICFDVMGTGGAVVVFGPKRDLLSAAHSFMKFFEHESCGYCTPCRVGNTLLRQRLKRIMDGYGQPEDIEYIEKLGHTIKTGSRCGLGQTSANPVITLLNVYRELFENLVKPSVDGLNPSFDLKKAVGLTEQIVGRKSVHHQE